MPTYIDDFQFGAVDPLEAETVLASCFASSRLDANDSQVRYFADDNRVGAVLHYGPDGAVLGLERRSGLSHSIEAELRDRWRRAFDVATAQVWRTPVLVSHPVIGTWRCDDICQIVPAPDDAPREEQLSADHPAVLEVSVRFGEEPTVNRLRIDRAVGEVSLQLSLILPQIVKAPSARQQSCWVMHRQLGDSPVWARRAYDLWGFEHLADGFSTPDAPSAPECGIDDEPGLIRYELTVPREGSDLLRCAEKLSKLDRVRFLRSCLWFRTASEGWALSQSLHLLCLVQAIECLVPQRGDGDPNAEVSTRFKQFLRRFGPGRPSGTEIDRLYELRSSLAHGRRLMAEDVLRSVAISPVSSRDIEASYAARAMVRGALLNWLWDHEQPGITVVVSGPRKVKSTFAKRVSIGPTIGQRGP